MLYNLPGQNTAVHPQAAENGTDHQTVRLGTALHPAPPTPSVSVCVDKIGSIYSPRPTRHALFMMSHSSLACRLLGIVKGTGWRPRRRALCK